MQTFLPYPSFSESAHVLDMKRLGKQRVEAFQLLIVNGDKWALAEREWRIKQGFMKDKPLRSGWKNHPAAIMWRRYPDALRLYYNVVLDEWLSRGYNNTMRHAPVSPCVEMPHWLYDEFFHSSHRSNLLRKKPDHYGPFKWTEGPDLEYVWPNETL